MKNLTKFSLLCLLGATFAASASAAVVTPMGPGGDYTGTQELVRIDHANGVPSFAYRPVERSTVAVFLDTGVGSAAYIATDNSRQRLIRKELRPGSPSIYYYRNTR